MPISQLSFIFILVSFYKWAVVFFHVDGLVGSQTKTKWSFIYFGPNYTCPVGASEQRVRLLIWRLWVWVPHGVLFFCRKWLRLGWKKKCFSTPSGTWTHNLTLRRGAPCPLGHGGLVLSWRTNSTQLSPTNWAQNLGRDKDPWLTVWYTASPPSLYQFWINVYVTL